MALVAVARAPAPPRGGQARACGVAVAGATALWRRSPAPRARLPVGSNLLKFT